MYTVARFWLDAPDANQKLQEIGTDLNKVIPGCFDGLDKVDGRFSCSVQKDRDWDTHVQAIICFVRQAQSMIREIQRFGGSVHIDTAIKAADREGRNVTSVDVPRELVGVLMEFDILLEFSVY